MSERPQEDLPRISVSPSEVRVETASRHARTGLSVINRGGGQLEATLEASHPWIECVPPVINGNSVRVEVRLDLGSLESDQVHEGEIRLRSGAIIFAIPVTVTRFGLTRTVQMYEAGQFEEARQAARHLLEAEPSRPDAAYVLACTLLDEGKDPAAVQVLRDMHALPGVDLPVRIIMHLVEAVAGALERLKGIEQARRLFELLATDPRVSAPAEKVLHDISRLAVDRRLSELEGETVTEADVQALRGQLEEAARRFPDDPSWAERRASLDELAGRRRRRGGIRRALLMAVVLSLVLSAVFVFWLLPLARTAAARSALAAGDYQAADRAASEVLYLQPDHEEAREVRGRAQLAWFQALQGRGDPTLAAPHLEAAARDLPRDPALVEIKKSFYVTWATRLLREGRFNLAYQKMLVAVSMSPNDEKLARRFRLLRPLDEFYDMLDRMPPAPLQPGPGDSWSTGALEVSTLPEASMWRREFKRAGLPWHTARLQVVRADLDGSGRRRLIVGGCDAAPHPGAAVAVFEAREEAQDGRRPVFRCLFQASGGGDPWWDGMVTRQVSGRSLAVLVVNFLRARGVGVGHSLLVFGSPSGVSAWSPPGSATPVRIHDQDGDGVPEIWAGRLIWDERRRDTAVIVPIPYRWNGQTGVPIPADFDAFYRTEFLPGLEKTVKEIPFPKGDPRRESFRRNAARARKLVFSLIGPQAPPP